MALFLCSIPDILPNNFEEDEDWKIRHSRENSVWGKGSEKETPKMQKPIAKPG